MSTHHFSRLNSVKKVILDALFPIYCFGCLQEGVWLCDHCMSKANIQNIQICPFCEQNVTERGNLCTACLETGKSNLDALISSVSYKEPAIKKLVHHFKYRFIGDISLPLAKLITKALVRNDFPLPDLLVPVPLHSKRLRWRGFNQSLLLATHISNDLAPLMKIDVLEVLIRRKYNTPQMNVKNYKKRLENVKNIFGLNPNFDPARIKKKNILLIDDIATTGATLQECAKVLKENGAKKVFAVVLSRQSID